MSFVLQLQRPAIEEFYDPCRKHPQLSPNSTFILDGKPVYFLGVSVGVGRNSKHQGMRVLVLGDGKPSKKREGLNLIPSCLYAVLLREPTKKEFKKHPPTPYATLEQTMCVEYLKVAKRSGKKVYLKSSGKIATYLET